ncbi:MAG: hypothetical protein IJW00_08105 [Clostridia bacterium]|nr:hypothetical protein [Clostridia bacterium]
MKTEKIILFLLCFCILINCTSCIADVFIDPTEYEIVSYNIVWSECEREFHTDLFPTQMYHRIKEVPTDQFIARRDHIWGTKTGYTKILMRRKDCETTLSFDVASAKLILCNHDINFTENEWLAYGQSIAEKEVARVDALLAEQLANDINADSPPYFEDYTGSMEKLYSEDGQVLQLKFEINEYDNLFWMAYIMKYDGRYFIAIREDFHVEKKLPCNEEFASVIKAVVEEYSLFDE